MSYTRELCDIASNLKRKLRSHDHIYACCLFVNTYRKTLTFVQFC